jgi:O-methyltransferase involved in polyketide biosynthesis
MATPTRPATDAEKKSVAEAREAFTNDSAFMIAYERAIETEKKSNSSMVVAEDGVSCECLVDDPFARMLGGEKGKDLSDSFGVSMAPKFGLWPDFHKQWTVVRTKFVDDHISRIVQETTETGEASAKDLQEGRLKLQFLNLGAGLDTRSLRLGCMKRISSSYEVDMEAINGPKAALFEAIGAGNEHPFLCPRKVVTANLTGEGELETSLLESGFDREMPTIVLAEGLIMYLGDKAEKFLRDVSGIVVASGSWLILNFIEHPGLTAEKVRELLIQGGWKDLAFNCFGDNILDYGRFNKAYEPSKAFSFVVCRKD